MKIIGITGGSGSGKTTCLNVFKEKGAYTIDCDALYHELLLNSPELLSELRKEFPGAFLTNKFDRKKLGGIVFSDSDKLLRLGEISHKYVKSEVLRIIEIEHKNKCKVLVLDAILLIESGLGKLCEKIIGVITPVHMRVRRIIAREGISEEYAAARISSQKNDEFYRQNCDFILDGSTDIQEFKQNCEELFNVIVK